MSAVAVADTDGLGQMSLFETVKHCLDYDTQRIDTWTSELTAEEINLLLYDPHVFLRPKQMMPQTALWEVWSVEAGRGFGKTELGSGNINLLAWDNPGIRIGLMGATLNEVLTAMLNGPSGIITRSHPQFRPVYNGKNRELKWPNGSVAYVFTGDEPEQLRSFQCHVFWIDELYKMRYQKEIWEQLKFVVRLKWQPGFTTWKRPVKILTSTPRKTKLCRDIRAQDGNGKVIVTTGSSFENATNLADEFLDGLRSIENTSIGKQEVYGGLLDDNPGALFKYDLINRHRYEFVSGKDAKTLEEQVRELLLTMDKIVIGVDPSVSDNERSDETGIVVAARRGDDGYVFDDLTIKGSPTEWARQVVKGYKKYECDVCIYEKNQGGLLVEQTIRNADNTLRCDGVSATKGKAIRAEPVSILYEQGRIHHVGEFVELEEQMTQFDPALGRNQKSPDRMDALVWALTRLFAKKTGSYQLFSLAR